MRAATLPAVGASLSIAAAGAADALAARLAAEMAERWRRGDRPLAEDFLARHPELRQEPEAAIQLIYEEICLRQELGLPSAQDQVLERFPHWREQLEVVLDCQRLLELDRALPRFPEAGQTLGDFRLLAEIGRGAVGRVFLALQPSLADRPVVLKLTRCDSQEYLSLARLQHTHIVPLHAVQDDPTRNLRLLCMPYFGGASLARVLEVLKDQPVAQRSGRDILDALDQAQAREVAIPTRGPDRQFLGRRFLRSGRVLDGGLPGRRAALCPRTWPGPSGPEALQRVAGRGCPAHVARFSPGS